MDSAWADGASAPQSATAQQARGTLYRVQGQGHTAYLFGTIHVGKPEFFPLEPQVMEDFTKSDALAVEFDISDTKAVQDAIFKYALYPNSGAIDKHVSPKTLDRLKKALTKLGLSYDGLSHMKAWMVADVMLIVSLEKQGYQGALATDSYFVKTAKDQNKKIVSLESADFQLSLFDKMPAKDQEAYLTDCLNDLESGTVAAKNQELLNAWEHADQKAFDGLLAEARDDKTVSGRFFYRELLQARNPPMAEKVAKMIKEHDNGFVAVGLLHLQGKEGLPQLLRKKGFTIERIY
jgi:uncharacterized protein YbaP (TraB family)